jgi:hypothetical protein
MRIMSGTAAAVPGARDQRTVPARTRAVCNRRHSEGAPLGRRGAALLSRSAEIKLRDAAEKAHVTLRTMADEMERARAAADL